MVALSLTAAAPHLVNHALPSDPYDARLLEEVEDYPATYGVMQITPSPAPAPWTVDDNENEDVLIDASQKQSPTDFTVTNMGVDKSIKVRIRNAQGGVVETKILNAPDSFTGTIPKGGKATLEDENDPDHDGASGTYTIL